MGIFLPSPITFDEMGDHPLPEAFEGAVDAAEFLGIVDGAITFGRRVQSAWAFAAVADGAIAADGDGLAVTTPEGTKACSYGGWVIRRGDGTLDTLSAAEFPLAYDFVS